MRDVRANAIRRGGGVIEATVFGRLETSCARAEIVDQYPGGRISYPTDPGVAQIFIEEWSEDLCESPFPWVPWIGHARIADAGRDYVDVYVNRRFVRRARVLDFLLERSDKAAGPKAAVPDPPEGAFVVIALLAILEPPPDRLAGCLIHPEGADYPDIYRQVFGPAPYKQCTDYVARHCEGAPSSRGPKPSKGGMAAASRGPGPGPDRGMAARRRRFRFAAAFLASGEGAFIDDCLDAFWRCLSVTADDPQKKPGDFGIGDVAAWGRILTCVIARLKPKYPHLPDPGDQPAIEAVAEAGLGNGWTIEDHIYALLDYKPEE